MLWLRKLAAALSFVATLITFAASAAADENVAVEFVIAARGQDELAALIAGFERERPAERRQTFAAVPALDPRAIVNAVPTGPSAVRIWVDATRADTYTLYIADAGLERILVRHLPVAAVDNGAEIARETLFDIVDTALDALADGAQIGITYEQARRLYAAPARGATPPQPGREAPSAPSSSALSPYAYELGVGYAAIALSSAHALHGPTARIGARRDAGALRVGLTLEGGYDVPFSVERSPLVLDITGASARLVLHAEHSLSPLATVRAGIGGGVDVLHTSVTQSAPSPALQLSRPGATTFGAVRLLVEARFAPAAGWPAFTIGASLDVDPTAHDFVLELAGASQTLLVVAPVRPGLFVVIGSR